MLGAPRLDRYLLETQNNLSEAVELYHWNVRLAGALHSQLSYFEVLTRNAMDKALREWNSIECGHNDWTVEHKTAPLLYSMIRRPIDQARRRAEKIAQSKSSYLGNQNVYITHDDIIAQLTLGNWSNLLGEALPIHKPNSKILWEACLHTAFPHIENSDQSRENLGKKFERLTRLRNRVAHQENLLKTNVRHRINDSLSVLRSINPEYPRWVMSNNQIRQIAREDPRKR